MPQRSMAAALPGANRIDAALAILNNAKMQRRRIV
jgi:hypothetical protein